MFLSHLRQLNQSRFSFTVNTHLSPDDLSIWNQSIDIDPDDLEEPVSSRTRSPHKPVPGRSGVGQGKRPDPGGQFKKPGDALSGQFHYF